MPPPWPHGLPSCWPVAPIAADGAAGNRQRPAAGDAAAFEPDLITIDRAAGDRQRPAAVVDAAASARGERIGCTSPVAADGAVGNRQRPVVEDAAALTATIAADNAVEDRQCRAAPEPSL